MSDDHELDLTLELLRTSVDFTDEIERRADVQLEGLDLNALEQMARAVNWRELGFWFALVGTSLSVLAGLRRRYTWTSSPMLGLTKDAWRSGWWGITPFSAVADLALILTLIQPAAGIRRRKRRPITERIASEVVRQMESTRAKLGELEEREEVIETRIADLEVESFDTNEIQVLDLEDDPLVLPGIGDFALFPEVPTVDFDEDDDVDPLAETHPILEVPSGERLVYRQSSTVAPTVIVSERDGDIVVRMDDVLVGTVDAQGTIRGFDDVMSDQLIDARDEARDLRTCLDQVRATVRQREDQLHSLRETLSGKQEELEQVRDKKQKAQQCIVRTKKEHAEEIGQAAAAVEKTFQEFRRVEHELTQTRAALESLRSVCERRVKERDEARQEAASLTELLVEARETEVIEVTPIVSVLACQQHATVPIAQCAHCRHINKVQTGRAALEDFLKDILDDDFPSVSIIKRRAAKLLGVREEQTECDTF